MLTHLNKAFICYALTFAGAVSAQTYPTKPIHLVVTAGPGSSADIIARVVGDEMGRQIGQTIVIDNRAGAGGNIAAEMVAKAAPDGYTLLMATISTHGINPSLYSAMRFDPIKDFAPISMMASSPNVLMVSSAFPAQSIKELVALAKSKPGQVTFASGGSGTSQHLAGEVFATATGTQLLHVPYKSAPQSMNAVLAGDVNMSFVSVPVALAQTKSKLANALGVTSPTSVTMWPDLPTIASQGLPGFDVSAWFGLVAPAGTPPAVITKLNTVVRQVMDTPAVKDSLNRQGVEIQTGTPAEFASYIRAEITRWAGVVKQSGAKLE